MPLSRSLGRNRKRYMGGEKLYMYLAAERTTAEDNAIVLVAAVVRVFVVVLVVLLVAMVMVVMVVVAIEWQCYGLYS